MHLGVIRLTVTTCMCHSENNAFVIGLIDCNNHQKYISCCHGVIKFHMCNCKVQYEIVQLSQQKRTGLQDHARLFKNLPNLQVIILAASLAKSCIISCKICARSCKIVQESCKKRDISRARASMQDSCTILQESVARSCKFVFAGLAHLH